jgi:hypothetical protein
MGNTRPHLDVEKNWINTCNGMALVIVIIAIISLDSESEYSAEKKWEIAANLNYFVIIIFVANVFLTIYPGL